MAASPVLGYSVLGTVWIKKGASVQRITFRLQQRENVFFKIGFACPGHGGT